MDTYILACQKLHPARTTSIKLKASEQAHLEKMQTISQTTGLHECQ